MQRIYIFLEENDFETPPPSPPPLSTPFGTSKRVGWVWRFSGTTR